VSCSVYVWYEGCRPFYVGIGDESRLKSPRRNKWATQRRKQAEARGTFKQEIVLIASRKTCIEIEKLLIATYGSVCKGGFLFNFTKGGDGGDTYSLQTSEKQREIVEKRKANTNPDAYSEGGKVGGAKAAEVNKERGNGPWNPEWARAGIEASILSRRENPEGWVEIGVMGAKASWNGEAGKKHREINAKACSKTGKKNKGRRWITDGRFNSYWRGSPGDLPEGWVFGRTMGVPYVRFTDPD
jgi:hypothetical protein